MEWLVKDIWTGSNEADDIMRLTIAMETSFGSRCSVCGMDGEQPNDRLTVAELPLGCCTIYLYDPVWHCSKANPMSRSV